MEQKIKMALIYRGLTQVDLASYLGTSPQNLGQRIKTGRFTMEELNAIAEFLGAKYRSEFVFPDGTVI